MVLMISVRSSLRPHLQLPFLFLRSRLADIVFDFVGRVGRLGFGKTALFFFEHFLLFIVFIYWVFARILSKSNG